jgi:hypothetical protein
MRVRTTKRLLTAASLVVFGAAGAIGYWATVPRGLDLEAPAGDSPSRLATAPANATGQNQPKRIAPHLTKAVATGTIAAVNWGRPLRRPLFDPPPPAPVVLPKAPPKPIRAQLVATVIEGEDSTAMLRLASGRVAFSKVGDVIEGEEPKTEILKIEAGSVSVRRGNEETRLTVEGAKGK